MFSREDRSEHAKWNTNKSCSKSIKVYHQNKPDESRECSKISATPVLYFTVILDIPRDHFTVAGSSPNKDCRYYFVCAEFILYLFYFQIVIYMLYS